MANTRSEVHAHIRRIFLDGYGVLDVYSVIFKCLRLSSRMRYLHGINDAIKVTLFDVINLFSDGKCPKMLGEYIASAPFMPLVKPRGYMWDRIDDIGLSMLLVDFKNAFNLVDQEVMLQEVRIRCPAISRWVEFCYSNPARLYYGEHTLWSHQGVQQGDPLGPLLFSFHFILGGPVSVDFDFSSKLVLKRVAKSIELIDVVFERAQHSFDAALRSSLERIVTASKPGFGDWRLAIDNALNAFNVKMKIDLLSNLSEIVAPKLMKKLTDIYFTSVTQTAELQMTLCKSQMKDHTSDWLRVAPISGLGQTMNGRTYQWDTYGDHVVSHVGIIGIKHRYNVMRDTLVDISVRVLSSSGVAPYNDATLEDLKTKHPFKPLPSLPHISIDHHHLVASPAVVLDRIKSFSRGTSCGRDGLHAQHLMDCLSGVAVAISDELVSSITQVVNLILDGKCPQQVGRVHCQVASGSEAIFHSVNRLIEACGEDVGLSMLLVDLKNAFNLVDREVMLREVRLCCPAISHWVEFCYSNPARLYYGEHTLWSCQGVQQGDPLGSLLFSLVLHPLIYKIRDSFSLSLHAWYLDDGTIVGDTVVVGKVLELIIEDGPGCGIHLNIDKTEVFWPKKDPRSRLAGFFLPNIARPLHGVKLLGGPASVDFDFCNELVMKRVAKTIELMDAIAKINDPQCELLLLRSCTGFGDWQWRLTTLPFAFGGLGVYSAGDVLNYAFLASRLQSAGLQTKLLRHTSIVSIGPIFDDALSVFNTSMEIDLLSNSSIPLFYVSKPCSTCSRVFAGDIYGDHVVSCAGIIGIKHSHNVVRDTLVDICYLSGISAGKEVDIGLDGGRDKPLRPADMLLYSCDGGLDVRKRGKYMANCAAIGYGFLPFSFSSLGELKADAVTLLKVIRKFSMTQDIGARAGVHIFNRISFAIAKGVGGIDSQNDVIIAAFALHNYIYNSDEKDMIFTTIEQNPNYTPSDELHDVRGHEQTLKMSFKEHPRR
ncbi:putative reverse transcriptase domain-containing protein [Tanacetum coccineum]